MPLPFNYSRPAVGHAGQLSDMGPSFVESAICGESTGLNSGLFVTTSAAVETGTGVRAPKVVRLPDGTRLPAGVLQWNPGRIRTPLDAYDVGYQEQCNIVRMGRIWMYCETDVADPTGGISDSWWFRKTVHGGLNILGALRYGDGDVVSSVATCTQLPTGTVRAMSAGMAGNLILLEVDFRHLGSMA